MSALNGKVSAEGGTINSGRSSSGLGILQGSVSTPVTHSFGLQLDAAAATAYSSFIGGGAAHLFWRDPQLGLAGPFALMTGGLGNRVGWYGIEGELYTGLLTLRAEAGYQDAVNNNGGRGTILSGGMFAARLTVYPIDNLALSAEGRLLAGKAVARLYVEYQPELLGLKNMSFYVDGAAGDDNFYRATAGVRFYFGPDKPLIRRHREDDPSEFPINTLMNSYSLPPVTTNYPPPSVTGGIF